MGWHNSVNASLPKQGHIPSSKGRVRFPVLLSRKSFFQKDCLSGISNAIFSFNTSWVGILIMTNNQSTMIVEECLENGWRL